MMCGSGGSKSRLAKAAGAEPSGQMRDEKLHFVVARSTFLWCRFFRRMTRTNQEVLSINPSIGMQFERPFIAWPLRNHTDAYMAQEKGRPCTCLSQVMSPTLAGLGARC